MARSVLQIIRLCHFEYFSRTLKQLAGLPDVRELGYGKVSMHLCRAVCVRPVMQSRNTNICKRYSVAMSSAHRVDRPTGTSDVISNTLPAAGL